MEQTRTIKIALAILSKGRAINFSSYTLKYLSNLEVHIFVEPQDFNNYLLYNPILKANKNFKLLQLPLNNQGVTYARNYIVNYFTKLNYDVLWVFDDNIKFFYIRDSTDYKKLITYYSNNFLQPISEKMFNENYAQASISFKPSNWLHQPEIKENTRVWGLTALNLPLLAKNNINYDLPIKLFQDYDITAQIFNKGLKNFVSYKYAFDKKMCQDNKACGTFRTKELSLAICKLLVEKYSPEVIKYKFNEEHKIFEPQFSWKKLANKNITDNKTKKLTDFF